MTGITDPDAQLRTLATRSRHLTALVRELQADVARHAGRQNGRYAGSAAVALADLTDALVEAAERLGDG